MSAEPAHIEIDVWVDADQITGQVADGVTAPRPFSGRFGLIVALDRALERLQRTDEHADERSAP